MAATPAVITVPVAHQLVLKGDRWTDCRWFEPTAAGACLAVPYLLRRRRPGQCGAVAEWSKALAWKVSIRQKRIEGSNPSRSATYSYKITIITEIGLGALLCSLLKAGMKMDSCGLVSFEWGNNLTAS
jgi:hypothetical protein